MTALRHATRRALILTGAWVAALLIGGGVGYLIADREPPMTPRYEFPDRTAQLLDQHDCWTGEAPADVEIPGGVVLTLPGKSEPQFSRRLVGPALEQIFGDGTTEYRIHGFCR